MAIPFPALFKVDSDWGSVFLITNKASIQQVPNFVYPPSVTFSGTQLFVGQQNDAQSGGTTVPFLVVSNGQPIDFASAHGDASAGSEPGNVTVELEGVGITLFNGDNTGDGVNVKVFPQVPLPT